MKVAVIGAGYTGLACAYKLSKKKIDVTLFEKEDVPGGLASGFKEEKWKWGIERHYHHWFTSDNAVKKLASEVGQKYIFKKPLTFIHYDKKNYRLDSPLSLLLFNKLSFYDRIKTGMTLSFLKYFSSWRNLEKYTAEDFIKKRMGKRSWEILWEPLFRGKFGENSPEISASWFWARIKKRSTRLGYPVGGYDSFSNLLVKKIKENGGKVLLNNKVKTIHKEKDKLFVKSEKGIFEFDKVVCTLPTDTFQNITEGLPESYSRIVNKFEMIGCVNLLLSLDISFLEENMYWLSINDEKMPFISVVQHTNFMNKKYYTNDNLLYIGNYLDKSHPYFKCSEKDLIRIFLPHLKKINGNLKEENIKKAWLFKDYFAQPVVKVGYYDSLYSFETPIKNLYLVNMQQIYPWDRGTNYAVESGYKVCEKLFVK